jgi:hypothetical protein
MNVATPTNSTAAAKTARSGAAAATAWPTASTIRLMLIRLRRSTMSPSGTRNASPNTYPIWLIVTSRPVVAVPTPKAWPSVCSSGCA